MHKVIHLLPVAYGGGAALPGCEDAPDRLLAAGLADALCRNSVEDIVEAPVMHPPPGTRWQRLGNLLNRHARHVEAALTADHLPLILGGDHSIAAGTWRGVGKALGQVPGLIWIDAHLDMHTPDTSPSGNPHGMPLAALCGHGHPAMCADLEEIGPALDPSRIAVIGLRSWEPAEKMLADRLGIRCYEMPEIRQRGLTSVLAEAIALVQGGHADAPFGISLDVDALDPGEAPGVGTPAAAGLTFAQLTAALHGLAHEAGFCAFELAEFNPRRDQGGQTQSHLLALLAALFADESADAMALELRYGAHNYAPAPIVLCRGEGPYLWDLEGQRYLDFLGAYSAASFGHAHPRLVAALAEQAGQLAVTSRAFYNDRLPFLLHRLTQLTGMDRALPMNTGAEAVETALKAARKWGEKIKGIAPGQTEIIVCEGNFHGRTIAVVGLSTEPQYRDGFGPFPGGVRQIPYGDAAALEAAITPQTAAFLVEPIQGEGGIRIPPPGYLAACAYICRRHNVLLMADEVQTGLGRTGRLLACDHDNVKPDGLCLGKALGGGLLPVSAFLARDDVMSVFTPGDHGSTFGGNALAAAVALEALALLVEERLPERAAQLGLDMLHRLSGKKLSGVREVRGRGLLIGIDLEPGWHDAQAICTRLAAAGVLTRVTHDTVLRIAPPLNIDEAALAEGIAAILDVFGADSAG